MTIKSKTTVTISNDDRTAERREAVKKKHGISSNQVFFEKAEKFYIAYLERKEPI